MASAYSPPAPRGAELIVGFCLSPGPTMSCKPPSLWLRLTGVQQATTLAPIPKEQPSPVPSGPKLGGRGALMGLVRGEQADLNCLQ